MSSEAPPAKTIPETNEEDEKERSRIVRLRENKRRSRARQKEYVQQLERRCREYEQAHVQATVEMQAAARKVAGENRLLRGLLKKMGADDHMVDSWIEGQGAEDARIGNHSLRRRSESSSTIMNGESHQEEGLYRQSFGNDARIDTIHLEQTHHYPAADNLHNPTSPRTHHVPLLIQPTLHFSEPQAQSYTYSTSSSAFTSGASTPIASTVASSPRLTMDTAYNSFFPAISPSPSLQPSFPPSSPLLDRSSLEKPPLVYIRLDPTNELYKLYPMSTIAIMPWLDPNNPMHDQELLHHHLANLNVNVSTAHIPCLSPKASTEQLEFPATTTYDNPYMHAHFSPKQGNLTLDDMARRGSGSWGGL